MEIQFTINATIQQELEIIHPDWDETKILTALRDGTIFTSLFGQDVGYFEYYPDSSAEFIIVARILGRELVDSEDFEFDQTELDEV